MNQDLVNRDFEPNEEVYFKVYDLKIIIVEKCIKNIEKYLQKRKNQKYF